jgi:hypothetical protein
VKRSNKSIDTTPNVSAATPLLLLGRRSSPTLDCIRSAHRTKKEEEPWKSACQPITHDAQQDIACRQLPKPCPLPIRSFDTDTELAPV